MNHLSPEFPFPVRNARAVVFGAEVELALWNDKVAKVRPSQSVPGCFESESMCFWQSETHSRGFRCAELVESIYGWSVRAASGLDNFELLASSRMGIVDGTFRGALDWAKNWAQQDVTKRYVLCFADKLPREFLAAQFPG